MKNEEILSPMLLQIMQAAWKLTGESPVHTTTSKEILKSMNRKPSQYSGLNKELSLLVDRGFLSRKVGCGDNPGTAAWVYSVIVTEKEYYARSHKDYLKNLYIGIPEDEAVEMFVRDIRCG